MSEIAIVRQMPELTQERLDAWKNLYCMGASNIEAELFIRTCRETGLSPEKRQIYLVPRFVGGRQTYSPQVSIDGFRSIAERSGVYGGQTPTQWCGSDAHWVDVWLSKSPPAASRVGVIRKDWSQPLYAVARWDAYAQSGKSGLNGTWAKMPDVMLAKCAEALALRKAFPNEMHGLYTEDEMANVQTIDIAPQQIQEKSPPTRFDKEKHWDWACRQLGITGEETYLDLLLLELEDKELDKATVLPLLKKAQHDAANKDMARIMIAEEHLVMEG